MELVTSPTSISVIKGEVNLLRYVSRRFNVFSVNELDEITIQVLIGPNHLYTYLMADK